jgi:hypothetical protein
MNRYTKAAKSFAVALLVALAAGCGTGGDPKEAEPVRRPPRIEPDYAGAVIPPNIAPLNFMVLEKAGEYRVEVSCAQGSPIRIVSRKPSIRIPLAPWRELLARNRGGAVRVSVSASDETGRWLRFDPFENRISADSIDGWLVYRRMPPLYRFWKKGMGIFERNIQTFEETRLLENESLNDGCFNCHAFCRNRPDRWMVHLRRVPATGMLLTVGGQTTLVNTQTEFNRAPAGHPAWHPGGNFLAFSTYKVRQFFHATGVNRDAYDMVSDLILYRVDANAVTSSPALADPKRMETYPAWSPDGKWLYFCSAPGFDTSTVFLDENYRNIRYDLVRVGFDPETARFSGLETVLSASDLGGSVAHPRVSPDGRWLLFCRSGYGNFPLFRSAGDLVMLDLESSRVRWLDAVNSSRSEGYHTWSSNGRWFVFSSTREDGIHTRPYFSHVDPDGNASKPFVLPQEDPSRYEHELETYNIPELVSAPIPQGSRLLTESALRQDKGIKAKYSPSM